jgi:PAS domain S-box-containing protein
MEDQTSLLLQRIAVLRHYLKAENFVPESATLTGIFLDLERALEHAQQESAALTREKSTVSHRAEMLEQKAATLAQHNELLEKQKANLERQNKTLERHNTILLRQNSQLERHNAAVYEKNELLEFERKRYQDLFDYAPDAYVISDNSGIILDANRTAAEMLKVTQAELKGENLINFIATRDHKMVISLLTRVRRIQDLELCIQPRGGPVLDTSLTLSSFYDETGHPVLLRWLLRDITERRRAMAVLNASERRFRTIFNEANLGILLIDLQGRLVRVNRAFQDLVGYSEDELSHHQINDLTCPEDTPIDQVTLALRENREANLALEYRFRRRDGQYVWTSFSLSTLRDETSQPQFLIGMVKDISLEKQAEVELAEMRRRLLESGEVERLRLAQELHDGPMQDLYGAVFHLSGFGDNSMDPALVNKHKELQEMIKVVANTLRVIVGELRPPTIGNLGLERAIRSHAERIADLHPELDIKLQLTRDEQNLPAHTRLAFFRIYQQCMANVLRHAQASQVLIAFHLDNQEMVLDVWDNGKGFTLPEKWVNLLREGHYGLAGIAERVEALGGELRIETKPGAGTLVHVTAPREKDV